MGWFDESDSEDEETRPLTMPPTSIKNDEEEEEDPLDAYMKSLQETKTVSSPKPRMERLDEDNADEATSHWVSAPNKKKNSKDINDPSSGKQAAKNALESSFHKAGKNNEFFDNIKLEDAQHSETKYESFTKVFWPPKDTPSGHQWRSKNLVTCSFGSINPITEFSEIAHLLGSDLVALMHKKGYTQPTAVQAQALAVAMAGRDALITAATGSGKTLAYVWPMVIHVCDQRVLEEGEGPIGLVLVPTRELALQVQKNVQAMLQPLQGKSIAITGGVGSYKVAQDFRKRGCEVVVATPGRFLDLLSVKKNGISLKRVTYLVLDECDKMLEMGFEHQVSEILNGIRPDRQTLMLSATMGRKIERVTQRWLTNPVRYVKRTAC